MAHLLSTALIVGLVATVSFLFLSPDIEEKAQASRIEKLEKISRQNVHEMANLLAELSRIKDSLEHKNNKAQVVKRRESIDAEDFAQRIEALEIAVEALGSSDSPAGARTKKRVLELYSQTKELYVEHGQNPHHSLAHEEFEKDGGRPLGHYTNSIEEILHASPGIEVSELDCKNSICRITYAENQSHDLTEHSGDGLEVVDLLARSIDEHAVEVRFATDPLGNKVMYVQLK